jgi:hypothetical protein
MLSYRRPRQQKTTSTQQGTEDDKMASSMLANRQHIGALANINPNTKLTLVSSTGKQVRFVPTTRITSPSTIRSKYKARYVLTTEENKYHKLLAADPVALSQLSMDITVPEASSAPPSPNISLRRVAGPRSFTPVTPPVTSK